MLCELQMYELEVTKLVDTATSMSEKQLQIFHLHLPTVANSVNIDSVDVEIIVVFNKYAKTAAFYKSTFGCASAVEGWLIIYRISLQKHWLLPDVLGLFNSIYADSSSSCVSRDVSVNRTFGGTVKSLLLCCISSRASYVGL